MQLVVEPRTGRRAAEQVVVLGEQPPHAARIHLHRRAVLARHAQRLEGHAVRVHQAQDVMVGLDDQRRRLGEGGVLRENAWIDVPVR